MDWRPLKAFRDRYVAPYAGLSYDLAPRAVGLPPEHLAELPELQDADVLVSADHVRSGPLHQRPSFRVVALNSLMRNALGVAEQGVVFSVYDLDDPLAGKLIQRLAPGESVILNSAVGRLTGEVVRRPDVAG